MDTDNIQLPKGKWHNSQRLIYIFNIESHSAVNTQRSLKYTMTRLKTCENNLGK